MVASNAWAEIIHHASDGILEERWLPGQMTDGAFVASLALLALEAERLRPSAILIDATQFQYRPGLAPSFAQMPRPTTAQFRSRLRE
jgi:hypothetical protein